jgi:subtilisin family serine protease
MRRWLHILFAMSIAVAACGGESVLDGTGDPAGTDAGPGPTTTAEGVSTTGQTTPVPQTTQPEPPPAHAAPVRPNAVIYTERFGLAVAGELIVVLDGEAGVGVADEVAASLGAEVVGAIPAVGAYQLAIGGQDEASLAAAVEAANADPRVSMAVSHEIGLLREDAPPPCLPSEEAAFDGRPGWGYRAIGLDRAYRLLRVSGVAMSDVSVGVIDRGLRMIDDLAGGDVTIKGLVDRDVFPESNAYTGARARSEHATDVISLIAADWQNGGMIGAAAGLGEHMTVTVSNATTDIDENGQEVAYKVTRAQMEEYGLGDIETEDVEGLSAFKMWVSLMDMLDSEPQPTIVNISAGMYHDPADRDKGDYAIGSAVFESFLPQLAQQYPEILFVAAATNESWIHTGRWDAFAGKKLDNVITVGYSDRQGNTQGAAEGDGEVTLVAPGVGIAATEHDGDIVTRTGTSYATPLVTSAAALIRSINPDLTAAEIKQIIVDSADTELRGTAIDPASGGRFLRIDEAVEAALATKLGDDFDGDRLLADLGIEASWAQVGPLDFSIAATIGAVTEGATTVEAVPSGPGDILGLWTQTLAEPGTLNWEAELDEADGTLYAVLTRFDSGDCRRLTLTADTLLSGVYTGTLPVIAEGYGEIGEIPFEIRVAEDLALLATMAGSITTTLDLVEVTYTADFTCAGEVFEDGSAECEGDGTATVSALGQVVETPSAISATGQITADGFDFTITGIGGTQTATAYREG